MLFELGGELYDLASPRDFATLPMPWRAKAGFVRLMVRAFRKTDWSDWEGRSARELIDAWAGGQARQALFEPLCQLKFQLPSDDVSAAWLGARLHFREGSTPLGYIPGANWTKVLCDGMTNLVTRAGVDLRLNATAVALQASGGRTTGVVLDNGDLLTGDVFVSTVPPPVYLRLAPADDTSHLASVAYTALISVVCSVPRVDVPPFYWLNLSSLRTTAAAIFRLDALNPTIGRDDEMCFNFVSHLNGANRTLFGLTDDELMARYLDDFQSLFGIRLSPEWVHVARVPMYSPVFDRDFRNPPLQSATYRNVFFAGNYRTYPSVASTGTALASGLSVAAAILEQARRRTAAPRGTQAA